MSILSVRVSSINIGCALWVPVLDAYLWGQPSIFNAVILKVPFLDVLSTLLDLTLPLTTLGYAEFGNPQDQSCFDYILKYSPYDNDPRGVCFPPMRELVYGKLQNGWERYEIYHMFELLVCSHPAFLPSPGVQSHGPT